MNSMRPPSARSYWRLGAAALLSTLLLSLAGAYAAGGLLQSGEPTPFGPGWTRPRPRSIRPQDSVPSTDQPQALLALLLGVDTRSEGAGRSDTLLVGAIDPRSGRLALVSIPRDTYVFLPGHGYEKINHAFAYGGTELALETVRRFLDLPITQFAAVDFGGFARVVDALGGVEVDIASRMYYVDPYDDLVIDFQPGRQRLSGAEAVKYVRFRADDQGDFGRIHRQQAVLRALEDQALQPRNLWRLPGLVRSLVDSVETNIPVTRLLQLAATGGNFLDQPLQAETIGGESRQVGGIFYLVPDIPLARATAHRVLLGADLPPDRLAAARADQTEMAAALRQARRTAAAPPAPAAAPVEAPVEAPLTVPTADPEPADSMSPADTAGDRRPAPAPDAGGVSGGGLPLPQLVLVDAAGDGTAAAFRDLLEQRGYDVVAVRPGEPAVGYVIIDGIGRPEILSDLLGVLPGAEVQVDTSGAQPFILIRIGRGAKPPIPPVEPSRS